MTPEIAMYIFGVAAIPGLGWVIHVTNQLRTIVKSQESAEIPGPLRELIEKQTAALSDLSASVRELKIWMQANNRTAT